MSDSPYLILILLYTCFLWLVLAANLLALFCVGIIRCYAAYRTNLTSLVTHVQDPVLSRQS